MDQNDTVAQLRKEISRIQSTCTLADGLHSWGVGVASAMIGCFVTMIAYAIQLTI
jgi:cell division protein FtsX